MSFQDLMSRSFSRRDVLKMGGLGALSLPTITSLGRLGDHTLLASTEEYGGFLVKTRAEGAPYEVNDSVYQRFDAYNNIFDRMDWDKTLQAKIGPEIKPPDQWIADDKPGFHREDFAFMNAAWTVASSLGTDSSGSGNQEGLFQLDPLQPATMEYATKWDRRDMTDQDVTQMVKKAAKFYGASLVGIAPFDERWLYTGTWNHAGDRHPVAVSDAVEKPAYQKDGTLAIPSTMHWVIAMAFEMDADAIDNYPNQIGAAGAANGYSKMAFTAACLAEFIRGLGYNAVPMGNQTAASVPMAIDAGIGELGRHGLLITPKYGPRVRLAKVVVDLPLVLDKPITFGVSEFCDVCGRCADECPSEAISKGAKTWKGTTISNNPGVRKWYIDPEKCFSEWARLGFSDCGTCIRVCPFNKPQGWLHESTRILIGAQTGPLDKLLLNLDSASGYGKQADADAFWAEDAYIHTR